MVRVLGAVISVLLFLLGVLFIIAAARANPVPRVVAGGVMVGMAAGVAWLTLSKRPEVVKRVEVTQQIELPGEINLAELKCQNCSAQLDRKSIQLKEGAIFIKCPYCGVDYQVVEEPQW